MCNSNHLLRWSKIVRYSADLSPPSQDAAFPPGLKLKEPAKWGCSLCFAPMGNERSSGYGHKSHANTPGSLSRLKRGILLLFGDKKCFPSDAEF